METKKNTIEALMEQGKTNGVITTKEFMDALENFDDDEQIADKIDRYLLHRLQEPQYKNS